MGIPTEEEEIADVPTDEDYLCEANDSECIEAEDAEDDEDTDEKSEAKSTDNKILQDKISELSAPKNETATDEEEEEDEANLDRLGSANILDNLGIMLFFLVVLILVVTLVIVLARVYRTNKKVQELIRKIKEKLFWNTFIRFVVQSTLSM